MFESLAKIAKWSEQECAQQLPFYLGGEVAHWYATVDVDKTDFNELKDASIKWYKSNQSLRFVWLDEFWTLK